MPGPGGGSDANRVASRGIPCKEGEPRHFSTQPVPEKSRGGVKHERSDECDRTNGAVITIDGGITSNYFCGMLPSPAGGLNRGFVPYAAIPSSQFRLLPIDVSRSAVFS